jgi:hypothetical protein
VAETLSVPRRFNGPLSSGQGGYSCALLAGQLEVPAQVTLRNPVPLDTALAVRRERGSVRMLDGERLIAEAEPGPAIDPGVPDRVSVEEARAATARYAGSDDGLFRRCFVCGPERDDTLGVFAGNVQGRELVASPWTPPAWTADEAGRVRQEFVWAVMDCPTYFAVYRDGERPTSFLGRMAARVEAEVPAGTEHVVVAWPISTEGRKRHAGAAVLSAGGDVLAVARALMIEPRESPQT